MTSELWLRPWARYAPAQRLALDAGGVTVPSGHAAPLLIYHRRVAPPKVDGRADTAQLVARMSERRFADGVRRDIETGLWLLPMTVRRRAVNTIKVDAGTCRLDWPNAPERPPPAADPRDENERKAQVLMLRAEAVWDRIGDVEDALHDPAHLWQTLRARWTGQDAQEPRMDVIVAHAQELGRVLDTLEHRPRRILRRVHRPLPVAQVQEIDRRAMLWLARQPGETLAERAGDDQRVLAVAREENFDTLENRVLRAYCELAHRHTREYLDRNRTRRQTRRAGRVEQFGKRCARLARQLAAHGIRSAEPGVTPNFVLQQNPLYQRIWTAWRELIDRERLKDELWRWQARSWEEFCALAIVVALMSVRDAQVVATAPLWFRDEHLRGRWVEADTPLAVVFLPGPGLIVEVQTGSRRDVFAGLGAPIWLRVGRVGEAQGLLTRAAVWPLWSPTGGLVPGESAELGTVLAQAEGGGLSGGLAIRPTTSHDRADREEQGRALILTLGTEGVALRDAIRFMTKFVENLIPGYSA